MFGLSFAKSHFPMFPARTENNEKQRSFYVVVVINHANGSTVGALEQITFIKSKQKYFTMCWSCIIHCCLSKGGNWGEKVKQHIGYYSGFLSLFGNNIAWGLWAKKSRLNKIFVCFFSLHFDLTVLEIFLSEVMVFLWHQFLVVCVIGGGYRAQEDKPS